jgi:membrane protease YdiL (CAAX protease family)
MDGGMTSVINFNLMVLGAIAAFAAYEWTVVGPDAALRMVGGPVATFALSALAACLLLVRHWSRQSAVYLVAAALIFVNGMALTWAPLVIDGFTRWGVLNWTGKLLSFGFCLLVLVMLPPDLRSETGAMRRSYPESRRSINIALAIFAVLGLALAFSGGDEPGGVVEAALFQLTMPSLAEELLFRGLLLALLARVAPNVWRWAGAPAGWSLIATSLLFGCVHGFVYAPSAGFVFQPVPIIATGVLGAALGWLVLRGGSIWPAVIAHSLLNATGPVLRWTGVI